MSQQLHNTIQEIIGRLATALDLECEIDINEPESETGVIEVRVRTESDARFLIGKSGQNLAALEHVVRVVCYRQLDARRRISVDVNGYRQERAQQLVELTRTAVAQVRDSGRSYALYPMNSADRRIVHTELAAYTDVESESTGEDPQRRVIIKPIAL